MSYLETFMDVAPYSIPQKEKEKLLTEELMSLVRMHSYNCIPYKRYLNAISYSEENVDSINDIPFFPVQLFKEIKLKSVPESQVFKITTSSGTQGGG